jgi:hypothetical protein
MSKIDMSVIRGWLGEEKWFYFICCMKNIHVGVLEECDCLLRGRTQEAAFMLCT